ncbi:MAG: hypothetical protein KGL11_10400 [Alphaproteobacteria bacterium]|nr:hypothetical protein [Alphaproteobacteria bacterium]
MLAEGQSHDCTPQVENKSSTTIAPAAAAVTADPAASRRAGLCGYVVAIGAAPFCDRPALPGGSYCAEHHARCAVGPASPDFAALADAQARAGDALAVPPPELGWLKAPSLPEPLDESDDERLAGLDLPPADIAGAP